MPDARDRRIDHILLGCGLFGPTLRVVSCERVPVEPVDGVQASDGCGLVADLAPTAHPPTLRVSPQP